MLLKETIPGRNDPCHCSSGKKYKKCCMLQSAQRDIERRKGRRLPPKRKYRRYENMLVPDRDRLDRFLAGLLDMMNQLYHRASVLFEIIPAWLRFIEMHGLIDAEARMQTLGGLVPLADHLRKIFSQYTDDPGPHQALHGWAKTAEI
jgi:SEC-C motif